MENSQTVIFTKRAFNAIITETISKDPIETGGIFLGYLLDNGVWVVVENIAPGFKSTHRSEYFEYDKEFVTYLANVIAAQYKHNSQMRILGLWHRHPGSMDYFSHTDDGTNMSYASDCEQGAISALVNCDPKWRMTMYHVLHNGGYKHIEWYVDDGDLIPEDLLELNFTSEDEAPSFDQVNLAPKDQSFSKDGGYDEGAAPLPLEGGYYEGAVPMFSDGRNNEGTVPIPPKDESQKYDLHQAMADIEKIVTKLLRRKLANELKDLWK